MHPILPSENVKSESPKSTADYPVSKHAENFAALEFEHQISNLTASRYAIAISPGNAVLPLLLRALKIGAEDWVLTSPIGLGTIANALRCSGAIPLCCDSTPNDLNIDPNQFETQLIPETKLVIVNHALGFPADLKTILPIAERHQILVVEDFSHALGASIADKPVGGWGNAGFLLFGSSPLLPDGEGGAIVTNDPALAQRLRCLANQLRCSTLEPPNHFSRNDFACEEPIAALGSICLKEQLEFGRLRSQIAHWYWEELRKEPLLTLPNSTVQPQQTINWVEYPIRLPSPALRQIVAKHLAARGIPSLFSYASLAYRNQLLTTAGDFPNMQKIAATTLNLPFAPQLNREQVAAISSAVKTILDLYRY